MDKKSKGIIIGTSVGLLAGAIAGILLAPQSGKETRADIAKYLHEMKDKIAVELSKVKNITEKTYADIVSKVVKVYEVEKKITSKDAEDIKDKLNKNFTEVKKVIKE